MTIKQSLVLINLTILLKLITEYFTHIFLYQQDITNAAIFRQSERHLWCNGSTNLFNAASKIHVRILADAVCRNYLKVPLLYRDIHAFSLSMSYILLFCSLLCVKTWLFTFYCKN